MFLYVCVLFKGKFVLFFFLVCVCVFCSKVNQQGKHVILGVFVCFFGGYTEREISRKQHAIS